MKNIRALLCLSPDLELSTATESRHATCLLRVQVSSWCHTEKIKNWPKPTSKTWTEPYKNYGIYIGSIKDLRPQNTLSTNINHKGLQRTASEYAEERRTYKDLISKSFPFKVLLVVPSIDPGETKVSVFPGASQVVTIKGMELGIPDLPFYKGRGVIMSSRSSVVAINWANENSGTALHWTLLQMALIKAASNYMSDFVNTQKGFHSLPWKLFRETNFYRFL